MSLIVETGDGLLDAESWCSVAEFKAHHLRFRPTNAAIAAASETEIEIALRRGTRYLVAIYENRWRGRRIRRDQSLPWPREGARDNDGHWIYGTEIPAVLKEALNEMAFRALTEDIIPDITNPGTIASESKTLGPLSKSVSYVGGKSQIKRYREIDLLLRKIVIPGDELRIG